MKSLSLIVAGCIIWLGSSVLPASAQDAVVVSPEFLHACTEGDVEVVQQALQEHPDWINGRSEQGEACLHVAGIYGKPDVTKILLEAGADPNVRSTFEYGLRMTPLSWNVYAGHIETARVLLETGKANVNLDFDAMGPAETKRRVTCYDIILEILQSFPENQGDARQEAYMDMKALLEEYGAKTFADVSVEETKEPDL